VEYEKQKPMNILELNEPIYKQESYEIISVCMEVHKTLGYGFLEAVYQEALAIEFEIRGIPFIKEPRLQIHYKGQLLQKEYQADFICFDKIILEVKALSTMSSEHIAQTLNYLKITHFKLALLANFGEQSLKYKRLVL
jgi:GxxExxY protein